MADENKPLNKYVRSMDFMGNPIYWLNGLTMDMAHKCENISCITMNSDFSWDNYAKYGVKRYQCEIILAPHHEEVVRESFLHLKDAKAWGIKEFEKHEKNQ